MKQIIRFCLSLVVFLSPSISHAGFPDDFSDVIWLDPNISSWSQTSTLTVNVSGTSTFFEHTRQASWPNTTHSIVGRCCNASIWVFIKRNDQWYASTFEYLRPNTPRKFTSSINGAHIKRAPFLVGNFDWHPADGEVYGFMVSGFARFTLNDVNIRERSNVFLYEWGVGPADRNAARNFEEVARDALGNAIDSSQPQPEPEPEPEPELEPELEAEAPEECVNPAPIINNHIFTGPATGLAEISSPITSEEVPANGEVKISVSDDRSLIFTLDGESFDAQVSQDGGFSGVINLDIGGICSASINVAGSVNGRNATGSGSGSDSCSFNGIPIEITFNANFNALSQTTPSFIDQRRTVDVCNATIPMAPIIDLLMNEEVK